MQVEFLLSYDNNYMHAYRFILTLTYIAKFSDISHSQPSVWIFKGRPILCICHSFPLPTTPRVYTNHLKHAQSPHLSHRKVSQQIHVYSYCEVKFKQVPVVYKFTIWKCLLLSPKQLHFSTINWMVADVKLVYSCKLIAETCRSM